MKKITETVDVVIAGGGTAGHIAALQAARAGVTTSVIEAGTMLGGTMTSGGVYMPNHFFSTENPVVLGIPWELYTKSKEIEGLPIPDYKKRRPVETPSYYSYINVPIYASIAEEEAVKADVILHYHESKDLLPKVPFRALIPKGSSRLTVAGRIVSADRVALAGIRAQCTCMAMGQAMGAAAALAVKKGIPSREINVKDIVALTVEHGAVPI
jgi:hypothetical protein